MTDNRWASVREKEYELERSSEVIAQRWDGSNHHLQVTESRE